MTDRRSEKGFTLIEVLVGLALLSVASIGIIHSVNLNIKTARAIETIALGAIVAENYIVDFRLEGGVIQLGTTASLVSSGNRQWQVVHTISETESRFLIQFKVEVSDSNDPESPVVERITYTRLAL